jgi:hypothetical protein
MIAVDRSTKGTSLLRRFITKITSRPMFGKRMDSGRARDGVDLRVTARPYLFKEFPSFFWLFDLLFDRFLGVAVEEELFWAFFSA